MNRATSHRRPNLHAPEDVAEWLRQWNSGHLIPTTEPLGRPWRNTSPRELESVADALLKVRAISDAAISAAGAPDTIRRRAGFGVPWGWEG